ncbi:hypothetical protein BDV11DRAFT_112410 [Aspergillus similis]
MSSRTPCNYLSLESNSAPYEKRPGFQSRRDKTVCEEVALRDWSGAPKGIEGSSRIRRNIVSFFFPWSLPLFLCSCCPVHSRKNKSK